MTSDSIILTGMFLSVVAGIGGAVVAKLLFARVGFLLAAATTCLGLAYFGYLPLFGGSHDPATFFGCTMLFLGLTSFILFAAIEEFSRRLKTTPP